MINLSWANRFWINERIVEAFVHFLFLIPSLARCIASCAVSPSSHQISSFNKASLPTTQEPFDSPLNHFKFVKENK